MIYRELCCIGSCVSESWPGTRPYMPELCDGVLIFVGCDQCICDRHICPLGVRSPLWHVDCKGCRFWWMHSVFLSAFSCVRGVFVWPEALSTLVPLGRFHGTGGVIFWLPKQVICSDPSELHSMCAVSLHSTTRSAAQSNPVSYIGCE